MIQRSIFILALVLGTLTSDLYAEDPDPVALFKAIAAKLPKVSTYKSGREFQLQEPVIDVTRTGSLINPLLGSIDFTIVSPDSVRTPMRFEFDWNGKAWAFGRLISRQNKRDITDLPGGREMLQHGALKEFVTPYKAK